MIFFSKNLGYLLDNRKCKQSDLAKIIDVVPNTVSNYKTGISKPDYEQLKTISDFFQVSVEDLLYHDLSENEGKLISRNLICNQGHENAQMICSQEETIKAMTETIAVQKDLIQELKKQRVLRDVEDVNNAAAG